MRLSVVVSGRPSRTRQTSVLVPPMSYVMKSVIPARAAVKQPWLTPPAGPDTVVRIGSRRAVSTVIIPPLDPIVRSEEHTSELQSHSDLVCRLLLEKKNKLKPLPAK